MSQVFKFSKSLLERIFLFLVLSFPLAHANAMTLEVGDLVVIDQNTDFDQFRLMSLADISSGTVILLTDRGIDSGGDFVSNSVNEGTITWTLGSAISAGETFQFTITAGSPASVSILEVADNVDRSSEGSTTGWSSFVLSTAGDQIIVYQGTDVSPTFVTGFHNSGLSDHPSPGEWQSGVTVVDSQSESFLPSGLTNNTNALAFSTFDDAAFATSQTTHQDNLAYNGPTTSADKTTWLTRIFDRTNWTGSQSVVQVGSISATAGNAGAAPTVNTNTAPVISNLDGDSLTYTQGTGSTLIDQGTAATVTDSDSIDFDGGNLTVTITSGEDAAEDTLLFVTSGSISLDGSTAGSNVRVGGVSVGTLGNNIAAGNDLVVNLNSDSTVARVQTLLQNVRYENIDAFTATKGARNVRFTLNDGDGGTSSNQDVTLTVDGPVTASSTASGFDTTDGTNLSPADAFGSQDDTLTIAAGSHLGGSSVANGQGGTDTLVIAAGVSADLTTSGFSLSNFENLTLNDGASATMTEAQHDTFAANTITAGAGTETITLGTTVDGILTGDADIDAYVLNDAYNFTLGSSGQNVTGNTGANQTLNVAALTPFGTLDGGAGGSDTLSMSNNANVSGATVSNFENLSLASGATVSFSAGQLSSFTGTVTAAGSEQLNIVGDGNFATLSNIETYSVGDDSTNARTITVSNATDAVSATSANDAITFNLGTLTFTSTIVGEGSVNDTVLLGNGANITGGTLTNIEVLGLASGATVDMTAAQYAGIQAQTITAAGAETINISGDGDVTINGTTVESYDFGDDSTNTRTINLGANNSNTFTANSTTDAITFDISTFDFTGSVTAETSVANTFVSDGANDISGGTVSGFTNLTLENSADLTMTVAQLNAFTGTITAAGTDSVVLSATGSVTGGNLSAIEQFATGGGGGITITIPAVDVTNKTLTATTSASDSFTVTGSSGSQTINGSAGNDSLSGGSGTDTINPGAGTDSMTGGADTDVFVGSASDLNGDTITDLADGETIRLTGITGLTTSNVRFNGSNTLEIDTDATTFAAPEVSITTTGAGNLLDITAVSDNGGNTDISFTISNSVPAFASLDGNPTHTEGGLAVILDADVTISDTELDALNLGDGNYSGATLTISRNGGADANDTFTGGSVVTLTEGNPLTYDSDSDTVPETYGTTTTNSAGALVLTFSDASSTPTTLIVGEIMNAIAYSFAGDQPPASVTLDWVFNDGTDNSTGTNQTVINITAVNDPPTDITVSSTTINQSATGTSTNIATLSATDADDTPTAFSLVSADTAGNGDCGAAGVNDADNSDFAISGTNLQTATALSSGSYEICIQVSDEDAGGAETFEKTFTITIADDVAPVLAEVTPVSDPTNDATPSVTFSSTEAGTIIVGGSCSTATLSATVGNNTISLDSDGAGGNLGNATFNDCTITVEDTNTNQSTPLSLTGFTVDTIAPTLDTGNSLPADNSANIAVTDVILLSYDENVLLGSGETITLFNVSNNAILETFTASSTTAATGSNGGNVSVNAVEITITPGSNLPAGTNIAVQYGASSVTDTAGNTSNAISTTTTYDVTTLPQLSIAVSPTTIAETGVVATFTVTLEDGDGDAFPADGNVTMTTTIDGGSSATGGGVDYNLAGTTSGGSFQIDSGQSTNTFTVTSVDDGQTGESPETVIFNISGPGGNAFISSTSSATLTITENLVPDLASSVPTAATINEDTTTNINYSAVTLTDGDDTSGTLTFAVNSGTVSSPLGNSGGVTVTGSESASMTLTGDFANIATFLDNANAVAVTPAENSTAAITVTVTPNDGTDDGAAETTTVTVTPVNDNPTLVTTVDGTFDFDATTGTLTNTDTRYSQTNNGITMTVDINASTWTNDNSGGGNSQDDSIYTGAQGPTQVDFAFDSPVSIASFRQFVVGAADGGTFTYTPDNGTNINETGANVASGAIISPVDWTNVNSFAVTNSGGAFNPAFDTLMYSAALSLPTTLTFTEDQIGNVDLSAFSFEDIDSTSFTLTLTVSSGTFSSPADGAGVGAGVVETLVNSTTITLEGALSDVSNYLDTASNIQYTGAADVNGLAAATITLAGNDGDGSGDITFSTLNININAVDDGSPVAQADSLTVLQAGTGTTLDGGAVSVLTNDTNLVDGPITLSQVSAPSFAATFSFNTTDGTFSYQHDGTENFSDSFQYRVQDVDGQNNTATVSISITETTPPVFSAVSPSTNASVRDASVGYSLSEALASGTVTYTRTGGTADGSSPHVVNLVGTELNAGTRAAAALTNAPTLVDGTIYTISFDGQDLVGNNATTVSTTGVRFDTTAPSGYSVSIDQASINSLNDNAVSFTFASAEIGATYSYSFTSDGGAGSVADTGTIATASDQITAVDLSSLPDGTITLTATLTDVAGNTGTIASDTQSKETVVPTVSSITRQSPTTEETGADTLVWHVAFSETIPNSNTLANDFAVTGVTGASIVVADANPAGDILSVTVSGGDLAGLNATVSLGFALGQDIADSAGNILLNTIPTGLNENTFNVVNNSAPVITEGDGETLIIDLDNASPFTLNLNATDADSSDILTWSISSGASNGTASVSATNTGTAQTISYSNGAGFSGTDSFVVEVSDGIATDTITISVISVVQNAIDIIADTFGNNGGSPTQQDYEDAGLTGVTTDQILRLINNAVATQTDRTDVDSLAELQALINAILEGQDDDNDGLPNIFEGDGSIDTDGDGTPDRNDIDSDNDGIADRIENGLDLTDSDDDGIIDIFDADVGNDAQVDAGKADTNFDGVNDDLDNLQDILDILAADGDSDGIPDLFDVSDVPVAPLNMKSSENVSESISPSLALGDDVNANGIEDDLETEFVIFNELSTINEDGDALPNQRDLDSDNDGVSDVTEAGLVDLDNDALLDDGETVVEDVADLPDTDTNSVPNFRQLKSDGVNNDLLSSGLDATTVDTNNDGRIDDVTDTDNDGLVDTSDLFSGFGNDNDRDDDGITDDQDPRVSTSPDVGSSSGISANGLWAVFALMSLVLIKLRKRLALIALAVFSTSTLAEDSSDRFFFQFALGEARFDNDLGSPLTFVDDEDKIAAVGLGYQAFGHYLFELRYSDLGTAEVQGGVNDAEIDYSAISLNVQRDHVFSEQHNLSVYGLIGITRVELESDELTLEESDNLDLQLGLGLKHQSEGHHIGFELTSYGGDIWTWSLAAGKRF